MTKRLSAVVLSAGYSSRMGMFKPLLPLGETTLIGNVLSTVCRLIDPEAVSVVLGFNARRLVPVVKKKGATAVINSDFEKGMFSSVRAGLRSLASTVEAFFLMPVDTPLVRPATLERLAAVWAKHPDRIIHPVFAGRKGHPPLIPSVLIPEILDSPEEGGLRAVLERNADRALTVAVADENILIDVDTPNDYRELLRRWDRRHHPSDAECKAILFDILAVDTGIIRHGRLVCKIAEAMCEALNKTGAGLDPHLVATAALLHDLAKGEPDHAGVGGRILKKFGFDRVGAIVAAHTDLPEKEIQDPKEAAIVYLADKLVVNDNHVSLENRFDRTLDRYRKNPVAVAAIERRQAAALNIKEVLETKTDSFLEHILADAGIHLDKGKR